MRLRLAVLEDLAEERLGAFVPGIVEEGAGRRDLDDAQVLLRAALREGAWQLRDLKYILPALLPAPLFRRLVGLAGNTG